jgi:uncharacterized membrane protein
MDQPHLLSVGILVEVAKIDEHGIPAHEHEGAQACIRQLNHQNSGNMLVEFIFGREIGGATSQNLEGGHS